MFFLYLAVIGLLIWFFYRMLHLDEDIDRSQLIEYNEEDEL